MTAIYDQWIRKIGLIVFSGDKGLDLSEFRIKFSVHNATAESPNTCEIRVYNLSPHTIDQIRGEFSNVELSAGYEGGSYGEVFQGTIIQYRIGRENATDNYLDILAADGDVFYNYATLNSSLSKGLSQADVLAHIKKETGIEMDTSALLIDSQHKPNIRGQILFGMARAHIRNIASTLDSGWSIQNGQVVLIDNKGYRDGEAVAINVNTGLIGVPEQTDEGIRITCLLNSKIRIGGKVQLNNSEVSQLMQADKNSIAQVSYNQWAGITPLAPLSPDGSYMAFSVEHEGDSRGNIWYTHIIGLAINETAKPNVSLGAQ